MKSTDTIEPRVLDIDRELYQLAGGLDTLLYVNPVNYLQEKRRFFARGHDYTPEFRYRPLKLDPYLIREKLYRLQVSSIQHPQLQALYRSVVDALSMKVELIASIGGDQFLYNSLKYYGEPQARDLANARFLLHVPDDAIKCEDPVRMPASEAIVAFQNAAKAFGLDCQVTGSQQLVAHAMVDNGRKTLLVNENLSFGQTQLQALIHHELGVHMVTTMNSLEQPLKVFRLGLPGNTHAQEGLAILCEYLSGNLTIKRLKGLAMRVLAIESVLSGKPFGLTCRMVEDEFGLSPEMAFGLTTRIYRGGGFTKDYVYLSGLRDLLSIWEEESITGLLIGKTGLPSLSLMNELVEQGILIKPSLTPPALAMEKQHNPVLQFLLGALQ